MRFLRSSLLPGCQPLVQRQPVFPGRLSMISFWATNGIDNKDGCGLPEEFQLLKLKKVGVCTYDRYFQKELGDPSANR